MTCLGQHKFNVIFKTNNTKMDEADVERRKIQLQAEIMMAIAECEREIT